MILLPASEKLNPSALTVLVTGGAGYVGSVLVPELLAAGCRVRVVDLFAFGHNTLPSDERLSTVCGDVCDYTMMADAVKGVDIIIHLAFVTDDCINQDLCRRYHSTNEEAPARLAAIGLEAGVKRFIFASSTSVYGEAGQDVYVDEDSPTKPIDNYGRAKLECEKKLLALNGSGIEIVVVRPSTVNGCSSRQRFDLLVNRLVVDGYFKGSMTVARANSIRPGVTIRDLARFYVQLAFEPAQLVSGQIFNLSYENSLVSDIAHNIATRFGKNVDRILVDTQDRRSYCVSSNKVLVRLGFEARESYIDSVIELIHKFEQGQYRDALNNSNYYNRFPK